MRLAQALAAELGAAVLLILPRAESALVGGCREHRHRSCEIEADAVVVAIPTGPLAEIEFDPPLAGATAEALRAVTYGQNSKLFLRLRSLRRRARSCPWPDISGPTHSWARTASLLPS